MTGSKREEKDLTKAEQINEKQICKIEFVCKRNS